MTLEILQIDAFADRPFAGNPAAVCVLTDERDDEWLQNVAMEMNLSETAFLWRREDDSFDLRWFTPAMEVRLCGHATLASAHAIFERGVLDGREVRFHTKSGVLTVRKTVDALEMELPADPPQPTREPDGLSRALGVSPVACFEGMSLLAELEDASALRALRPDFGRLMSLELAGLVVTAPSDEPRYDFLSRYFAPWAGVDEDPVTGSSFCILGPHWQQKLGKEEMLARQVSRRGGVAGVRVEGDNVYITGKAITVLRGELLA